MLNKTDTRLGNEVAVMLKDRGIETPILSGKSEADYTNWLTSDHIFQGIMSHFAEIMKLMRLDLEDDSLVDTPERLAKMFTREVFVGLDYANFPKVTLNKNKMGYDSMLIERDISVKSYCEHHFVAIDGVATVAYIPKGDVIGLSKLNRIVNFFARRPQVQERMTEQIHATLCHILDMQDVAVVINSVHHCVRHRGIQDVNCSTITSKLGGAFKEDPATRSEFMKLAGIR